MSDDYIVQVKHLSRRFGSRMVVYNLSMNIPKGYIYGLLGPNGAGKSTTIKTLTGRIRPTSGNVRVFGLDPWTHRKLINFRLGYLPENPSFYQDMKVLSFTRLMARLYNFSRSEALSRARIVLDLLGLGRFEDYRVGNLSQGQKQRLGFACAILNEPEFLILDEPTANLDPEGRVYVMELISRLRDEGKTILISSHILPEIERMCDHIGIISNGHLLTSQKTTQLIKDVYDLEYKIVVSDPETLVKEFSGWDFIANFTLEDNLIIVEIKNDRLNDLWKAVPKFCSENNIELRTMSPVKDPLEKVFLSLVHTGGA
ncbi:MAG: ABC transporter ATP-binding protein [Candidatus Heimdallarchaeum aukensis]|uniref:ABC transporter ATP-binding protein n=1 Tax=Candidatus Heimdallarchaeum aukensis TaxID=2876573 RepID=A0A9Y1FK89_9ARCH|nr:MAG: ABC transporter ATP-binding protein [Candidatus Heimdallarchaeum aukensis]